MKPQEAENILISHDLVTPEVAETVLAATPEEAEIILAVTPDLVSPQQAELILAKHGLEFARGFTEIWDWSCKRWVGGLRPKRAIKARVKTALSKITAKERRELIEPNVRILCNTDLYYRHGLFARYQERHEKWPSIFSDVISSGVTFLEAIAELSLSNVPDAIASSAPVNREALTDLCWQVIDVIEAAEIERANNDGPKQIALVTAMDCYEAATGTAPEKRRGRSLRKDPAVNILMATILDCDEALKAISAELESADSDEYRRIKRERSLAAKIALAKMLACSKALFRIGAESERANSDHEGDSPKKRRTRTDCNCSAADIAIAARYCYESLTGRRATVATDWDENRAYGPYLNLVDELFEAFSIDAKPEHYARQALRA